MSCDKCAAVASCSRPTASATKRPLDRGLSDVDDDDSDVRPSPWRSSARKRQSRSRLLAYDVDGDPLRDDDEGGGRGGPCRASVARLRADLHGS